ncbi:nuclear transport factor 2 family protein [Nocardioides sp. Soil796]|uniref:nuclear transport factor 2 family protein n=1 Tax=Nocardioides sp. Soil796 TaxID=1736412 RepID=UPI000709C084|nr:nuclear transport factor 2 family protein [Nocardioides sp. Soil796]KRF15701.1 hypothetical protein ASH02_03370 [Nocardioides sp. Soil796]
MTDTAALARRFVETLQRRDWEAWAALMTVDVVYEMPQTRERIAGREGYLEFNRTYPGEWELTPYVVIGDGTQAVVWFTWRLDGSEAGDAQAFFEFDDAGLITKVTDFWPEPYDPPARPEGLIERW